MYMFRSLIFYIKFEVLILFLFFVSFFSTLETDSEFTLSGNLLGVEELRYLLL